MAYKELGEILNPFIIDCINQEKGFAVLKEDNPNSKLKKLEIHGLANDAVVFKLDIDRSEFKYKSPYLNPREKGIHSGCDYVIATSNEQRNILLFCELKSDDIGGGKQQLQNAVPFVDYLFFLLQVHKNISKDVLASFEKHYVLFSTTRRIRRQRAKNNILRKEPFGDLKIVMGGDPDKINISKIIQ